MKRLFLGLLALAVLAAGHLYIPARKEVWIEAPPAPPGASEVVPAVVTWAAESVESADECRLLAQVLQARRVEDLARDMPVVGDTNVELRCDWPRAGVKARGLTKAERRNREDHGLIRPDGSGGFVPVILLGAPRYSLLRTRAVVETGVVWGELSGHGEQCFFFRTPAGWALERCRFTWMA